MSSDDVLSLALQFTLKAEGGFSDNVNDPGGRTNYGITESTYSAWLKSKDMPNADVRTITVQEVTEIYKQNYWHGLESLSEAAPALAVAVFDFGVNIGTVRARQALQRRLSVVTDGVIGPATVSRVTEDLPTALQYNEDRTAWYEMHSQRIFMKGLLNRVENLTEFLQGHFGSTTGAEAA